jgi:hypothetical protein
MIIWEKEILSEAYISKNKYSEITFAGHAVQAANYRSLWLG